MTLGFDQKEDLHLRMMELEKKLAESEEERSKLEKTCNILLRAFREEEKMRYKALNKKYEKFLEDYTQRRRRNDIILKSLCRIEDRARALFAKTERLKILKDRYISYLKVSDIKQNEPNLTTKNFPYSPSLKIIHDVTPKSVHWKSPYTSDVMMDLKVKEVVESEGKSFSKYGITGESLPRENKEDFFEDILTPRRTLELKKLEKDTVKYGNSGQKVFSKDCIDGFEIQENSKQTIENFKPPKRPEIRENPNTNLKNETKSDYINYTPTTQDTDLKKDLLYSATTNRESSFFSNEPEGKNLIEMEAMREKVAVTHQESIEKLKKALSVEEDDEVKNNKFKNTEETQKIIEKDEVEMNEKNQFQNNLKKINEDLNRLVISKADTDPYSELKNDAITLEPHNLHGNIEDVKPKNFPVGLDGVDYQNETYPESYYEQPVRQNHTSIASDVILEEDESEQDIEQNISEEAKNCNLESENKSDLSKNNQEIGQLDDSYHEKQSSYADNKNNPYCDLHKSNSREKQLKIDSTSFDKDDCSGKSDITLNSEKSNKRAPQSNLLHLLESDSESFQIEHGDLAAGNEDSDFDFSFNQN